MGAKSGKVMPEEKSSDNEKIVFLYDFRSASKHFICGTYLYSSAIDESNIKRYDDFDIIQHRRGVEIRKIAFFKKDGKMVGYEIEYYDSKKKKLILKRIAKKYSQVALKKNADVLKLGYNEHIADIEVVYTNDDIKYVEIMTSKGQILRSGTQPEDCYSSVSKVDVSTRLFTPIIAFATTFTPDGMKEILIYRCPVRISKSKFKKEYTVNEINNMKNQPAQEPPKSDFIRDITKKSMAQMKVLKAFDNILSKTKTAPMLNVTKSVISKQEATKPSKDEKIDALEKYDMGIESDEDEDEKKKKKKEDKPLTAKERLAKSITGKLGLFRQSSGKAQPQPQPQTQPAAAATAVNRTKTNFFKEIFSPLKAIGNKKSVGNSESPGLSKSRDNQSDNETSEKKLDTVPPMNRHSSLFLIKKKDDSANSSHDRKNSLSIMEKLFKTTIPALKANVDDDRSNVSSPGVQRPLLIPLNKTADEDNSNPTNNIISNQIKNKLISKLGMARSFSKK